MPDPLISGRYQPAVLWTFSDKVDPTYGRPVVNAPIEIQVHWTETRREGNSTTEGSEAIDARVIVDRDITVGSAMWLGPLASLTGTPPRDYMRVERFEKVADVRGRVHYREVSLRKAISDVEPLQ